MDKNEEKLENEEMLDDEMLDDVQTTIILTDESGEEVEFEFLDLIPYQENEYMVLMPLDDEEEDAEVVILQYEKTEEGKETYAGVLDEEVLDAVYNIFKEKWADHFNFVEE